MAILLPTLVSGIIELLHHDFRAIAQQTLQLLRVVYLEGYDYAKAGILLSELTDAKGLQADLFDAAATDKPHNAKSERLMAVMDEVNRKCRSTIYMAREAGLAVYAMRREHLSPAYTTSWEALPWVQ